MVGWIQSNQCKRTFFAPNPVRHLHRFDAPGEEQYCLRQNRLYKPYPPVSLFFMMCLRWRMVPGIQENFSDIEFAQAKVGCDVRFRGVVFLARF